jgi:hypothetical protein
MILAASAGPTPGSASSSAVAAVLMLTTAAAGFEAWADWRALGPWAYAAKLVRLPAIKTAASVKASDLRTMQSSTAELRPPGGGWDRPMPSSPLKGPNSSPGSTSRSREEMEQDCCRRHARRPRHRKPLWVRMLGLGGQRRRAARRIRPSHATPSGGAGARERRCQAIC